jgi:hypothetical protein
MLKSRIVKAAIRATIAAKGFGAEVVRPEAIVPPPVEELFTGRSCDDWSAVS